MNDLAQTRPPQQFSGSSEASALTVELAKMLILVAPITMTAEQQELWLRAAVDALDGIRTAEVRDISAELRRKVTRPNQIVPEIANLVAERRAERCRAPSLPALPPLPPRQSGPALDAGEIRAMPNWLKDMGLRVGFLKRDGDRIVDAGR